MTVLKCSVGLSRCVFWEQEVTRSQGWWNACAHGLTYCKGRKAWVTCKGLSSTCARVCVHARACNTCVGERMKMENHEVGEGGVWCWWCNELQTGTAFSPQGPPASCGCCLGNGWGIMRNAWKRYLSFGLMDGAEGGGWLFSVCCCFYIQQIRQAGCCGDDTEEVSCTPAPQTRSPANTDLRNPEGIFFFFLFFPMASAQEDGEGEKRGGDGKRRRMERWREKPINIQSA